VHWIHERRLRWLFDFIDPDPARRRAARLRYDRYIAEWSEAVRREYAVWWSNGRSYDFSAAPALDAAFERHIAERQAALDNTFYGVVRSFEKASWHADQTATFELLAPYAVLFLQWEAAYPAEWREAAPWSPWGTKQQILRSFIRAGVPPLNRAHLVELVTHAVSREQRCEDRWYAALARRLDGSQLRAALDECRKSADGVVRLRAEYVLTVLNDAEMPVTLASWRRWLAAPPDTTPTPAPSP
jgi:hypothetical protein